jgi:hypothetical protein
MAFEFCHARKPHLWRTRAFGCDQGPVGSLANTDCAAGTEAYEPQEAAAQRDVGSKRKRIERQRAVSDSIRHAIASRVAMGMDRADRARYLGMAGRDRLGCRQIVPLAR